MTIDLSGRVAIVTGAGGGLGRSHALALAARGAKVIVNDLGGARDGTGRALAAAQAVVAEIEALGGEAMANGASVTSVEETQAMVADAVARWGRVDILVNNAGILRDRTFAKQDLADFRAVFDVHFMGSVNCAKAAWPVMSQQKYGRIIFTTSSSGLYGNFGQAAYGAAKMAVVGLMNTLRIEGARCDIRVNCLSPSAATRMTGEVLDEGLLAALAPGKVSAAIVALAAPDAPNGAIVCAGAGSFERAYITLTEGRVLGDGGQVPEALLERFAEISDRTGEGVPVQGPLQAIYEVERAKAAMVGVDAA